ncbi:MAG: hypothetical protein HYW02_07490, partial [Deltaproteobacteria bacterium]|nr:hypothetical protein [Deltaproteobacteria bacterium]
MGKANEVEYYLDPTAVRIYQELTYLHPDEVNNDGVLTSKEVTDLFDRNGDRQITGQEIFTTLRPLSGLTLWNYNDVVGKQLEALLGKNWDADFKNTLSASGQETWTETWQIGTELFVRPSQDRLPLFHPISELESTDIQREWDAEGARQKIEEVLKSRGVDLRSVEGTRLSEEASNLYVDWFLSSVPIVHPGGIGMALLKRFPNMGSDRKNLLLDPVSLFLNESPFEALPLLDTPLTPHQREMIGHLILAHGTDADGACLEQKDPDLVSRLRARFYYSTEGYVRDLGRHHFVD